MPVEPTDEKAAKQPERTLTQAEVRRTETFERVCADMAAQGRKRNDLTVSIVRANVMALVVSLPPIVLIIALYLALNCFGGSATQMNLSISVGFGQVLLGIAGFLLAYLVLVVVHELIHGLFFGLFAPSHWRTIEFGVIWKYLTPYCTCGEPLLWWHYLIGSLAPGVILGLAPGIIGAVTGQIWILPMVVLMIIGAGGDILVALKLLRHHATCRNAIYLDHPSECGLVAFEAPVAA